MREETDKGKSLKGHLCSLPRNNVGDSNLMKDDDHNGGLPGRPGGTRGRQDVSST